MKKFFLGLMAAFLMSAGLVVATSAAPASAACGNPQYPACFEGVVSTQIIKNENKPRKRTISVQVDAKGTNATPVGRVKFTFTNPNGRTFSVFRQVGEDGSVNLSRGFGLKGQWSVRITYIARDGSVFDGDSSPTKTFTI